jgi:small subunit ribosomal protein S18
MSQRNIDAGGGRSSYGGGQGGGYGGGGYGADFDDREFGRTPDLNSDAPGRRRLGRKRVCRYCADKALVIDYKDPQALKYFISERGKVVPRRISGNCALHQRKVTLAIKRSRNIALLPFTVTA